MTQRRASFTSLAVCAALLVGAALPGTATAAAYWHPANNEGGVTVHPEHFQSSKTREQVRAEAIEAMRNGDMAHVSESGEPAAVRYTGASSLTRQEVRDALASEPAAERDARLEMLAE